MAVKHLSMVDSIPTESPAYSGLPNTHISGLECWCDGTNVHTATGLVALPDGTMLDISGDLTLPATGLTVDSQYHLYGYDNGGTPAIELTPTVPVVYQGTARHQSGNAGRRWLDTFVSDASGELVGQRRAGSAVTFYGRAVNAAPLRRLSAGKALTETAVAIFPVVPVGTRLLARITHTAAGQNKTMFLFGNDGIRQALVYDNSSVDILLNMDSSGNVSYYLTDISVNQSAYIDVYGWRRQR